MERSSTDYNLSVIASRNQGRRSSLVVDENEEFGDTDLPMETIRAKINVIEKAHKHLRLRKQDKKVGLKENGAKTETETESESDHSPNNIYRSQFGDIKFLETSTTIIDSENFKKSQFYGIYVLFWLGTAFLMLNNIVHGYLDSEGKIFYQLEVISILRKDLFKIAATDLAMYLSTYFAFFVQLLCKYKVIKWNSTGWLIQGIYDFVYLVFWGLFASEHMFGFPWIGRVFLLLHSLVFLMKMHSYGFYNGYLWHIREELQFSEKYLERCVPGNPKIPGDADIEKTQEVLKNSIKFCKFELEQQSLSHFHSDDPNVMKNLPPIEFPKNINLKNWFDFTMYPTVVYTLNFPRTKRIRWKYVSERVCAVFGIFFLMILVAQNGMYPLVVKANESKTLPIMQRTLQYFLVLIDMIPYFLLQYLFTFFIIWEFILNVVAEVSRFADRDFYGPWWSCTDWGEFARIWNRPVHKFLLRHVYHSSISTIKLNKVQASLFTFILSSLVHELVMFCIFRTFRGYLLLFQLSQLPLMMISETRFMRDKKVLGNVICWIGFISGPSIICTLYLFF